MGVKRLLIPDDVAVVELLGQYDRRARFLRKRFGVDITVVDDEIWIVGDDEKHVEKAQKILSEVIEITREGHILSWEEFRYIVERSDNGSHGLNSKNVQSSRDSGVKVLQGELIASKVKAWTEGQKRYIEAMRKNEIVFAIGPAGTGKTYLAVAMAVDSLKSGRVQRIILTRPAVEAGEKLGFLPGTLLEKVDPYLRPLYDALLDMMSPDRVQFYKERGVIEIVPLAYMRGRTLNNSFIILDEAQNTTYQQMKMFLTRIGFNSKVVVTGDITQIDLEKGNISGLVEVQKILKGIEGIEFIYLEEEDVVRNPLVREIVRAYDRFERETRE
ncbi:MAG: phosphate starvation-inducible protein PhoH [Thermotogota bacterium]|nr:phosphate starvation-inducible protein PhoH [Thermotogota bacterium]MDK2863917.1 phosphate starvation-inducible protein PhoH [Thermotogota bacterium]HCZ06648.1 PhoH family protein [Thermotogota bacterium]